FIMGSKTYDTIGRPLPGRKNIVMSRKYREYINGEEMEMYHKVFTGKNEEWVAVKHNDSDKNLVITSQSPQQILDDLEKEGLNEVVLAGGAIINSLFLEAGLIDEIVLTISPKVFGEGISLFDGNVELDLKLLSVEKLGENSVLAKYKVLK
ncbi:MAG: dihydrofolate reductase family protein, partial [Candidatus Peregrinibacteria bacterium]|nr:dihydrofolate reductase family protein [Candidatus Peregrinibacteria bacterium]